MKHTKGPWVLKYPNIKEQNGDIVAKFEGSKNDANLVAAAPELLENFQKAIRLIEHIQETHGLVYEVTIRDGYRLIKKANGDL